MLFSRNNRLGRFVVLLDVPVEFTDLGSRIGNGFMQSLHHEWSITTITINNRRLAAQVQYHGACWQAEGRVI